MILFTQRRDGSDMNVSLTSLLGALCVKHIVFVNGVTTWTPSVQRLSCKGAVYYYKCVHVELR